MLYLKKKQYIIFCIIHDSQIKFGFCKLNRIIIILAYMINLIIKKIFNINNVQFLFCENINFKRETKEYKKQYRNIYNIKKIAHIYVYFVFKEERK